MKRMLRFCLLVFVLIFSWSMVYSADFYVIPVKKCCTCKGTLYENRWCDNGDGTVTDLITCLVWLQKADWGESKPWRNSSPDCSYSSYTCYDDAHKRAGLLYAGAIGANLSDGSVAGDWRLPTKTELGGLVNGVPTLRCIAGLCDLYAFTGVQSSGYWSSTTYTSFPASAWFMFLGNGNAGGDFKINDHYVWPVRRGQDVRLILRDKMRVK